MVKVIWWSFLGQVALFEVVGKEGQAEEHDRGADGAKDDAEDAAFTLDEGLLGVVRLVENGDHFPHVIGGRGGAEL